MLEASTLQASTDPLSALNQACLSLTSPQRPHRPIWLAVHTQTLPLSSCSLGLGISLGGASPSLEPEWEPNWQQEPWRWVPWSVSVGGRRLKSVRPS